MKTRKQENKGFSFITGILLFTGAAMIALLAIAMLQVTGGENEYTSRRYHELEAFGDGCAEEAIIRLKRDQMFRGAGLSDADNSCTINVEETEPATYKISIIAMNSNNQSFRIVAEVRREISEHGINIEALSFSTF